MASLDRWRCRILARRAPGVIAPRHRSAHESDRRYALSALSRMAGRTVAVIIGLLGRTARPLAIDRRAVVDVAIARRAVMVAGRMALEEGRCGVRVPVILA